MRIYAASQSDDLRDLIYRFLGEDVWVHLRFHVTWPGQTFRDAYVQFLEVTPEDQVFYHGVTGTENYIYQLRSPIDHVWRSSMEDMLSNYDMVYPLDIYSTDDIIDMSREGMGN